MQKIKSLFVRDYDGNRQVIDEIVPGSEWVGAGEGIGTVKHDGTSCLVRDGKLYKRYDCKKGKDAPPGWEAAEAEPDAKTGHWPGWLLIGDGPDDQWHRQAFATAALPDGTYELVGPKIQGNIYNLDSHQLWKHGMTEIEAPRTFDELKSWFQDHAIEGLVWHHPDGRMVKIKRRDFGLKWPESK